jgi:glycolate oxidase
MEISFQKFETVGGRKVYVPSRHEKHNEILKELIKIVGEKFVSDDMATLYVYGAVPTEHDFYLPEMVVLPKTTEELSESIKIANKYKVPIQVVVSANNTGAVHHLLTGGILIDLRRMNRILEVNEDSMYTLIEPGVTWADLWRYLKDNHPDLRFSPIFSPPFASVMGNVILDGHNKYGLIYGSPYNHAISAEVVLPTGEIVYLGSRALTKYWGVRNPVPDLFGLFLGGWHGATGVVTKMAYRLCLKPKLEEEVIVEFNNARDAFNFARRLARSRVVDVIHMMDWRFLIIYMMKAAKVPPEKPPDMLELAADVVYSSVEGEDEEIKYKKKFTESLAQKYNAKSVKPLEEYGPEMYRVVSIPGQACMNPNGLGICFTGAGKGSGFSWVGGLGEDRFFEELYKGTVKIFDKYDKIFLQNFFQEKLWGHIGCFREIVSFDVCDPEQVEQVRKAHEEEVRLLLDHGYLPYKPPKFATDIIINEYMDKGFYQLMKKIREALDPNHIMAPGRWEL